MAGVGGSCRVMAISHHHHHHHYHYGRTLIPTPLSQSQLKLHNPFSSPSQFTLPLTTTTAITTTRIPSAATSIMSYATASSTPFTAVDTQQQTATTTSPSGSWSEFAQNVSGEWDGYGADFTIDGKPIELPENVVPEAYREWGVKVFDWQTQCPTLAYTHDLSAMYKLIKLLPTVGCEADAATRFSIDERHIGGADNMVSAFAYQSNGCYAAVWATKGSSRVLELEHCLIDPRDKESRVRIIQVVVVDGNHKLVLKTIRVFVEQWYGPFRNGEQLGGCAIRDSAFASTQALTISEVAGVWQGSRIVASFQNSPDSIVQELVVDGGVEKSVTDGQNMVLLPKNLWSSIKEGEDGETCCEVGWLLEPGRAITSKCVFSGNSELKEIITSSETAALGQ